MFGKIPHNYKGGKPHCIDCNKVLKNIYAKRCEKCHHIFCSGKNHHNFQHGAFKCLICKKPYNRHKTKTKICRKCAKGKYHWLFKKFGKSANNFVHGNGYAPYPLKFNNLLKFKIRQRDNFMCQCCKRTEKQEIKKINRVLSIHHIDYNKENCKEDNLITVCNKCNSKANNNRNYWFAYYTYIIEHFITKN